MRAACDGEDGCGDGFCIHGDSERCDGILHCPDGSDEDEYDCMTTTEESFTTEELLPDTTEPEGERLHYVLVAALRAGN